MTSTVLVVDDEPDIREVVHIALTDAGYVVRECGDGLEALNLLTTSAEPLIVLLDLMLPRMDGNEIIKTLFSDPDQPCMHCIIATTANYRLSHSITTQSYAHQVAILHKPFEITELLALVEAADHALASHPRPSEVPVPLTTLRYPDNAQVVRDAESSVSSE